ncbi:penicillin-binding transpeptidase domain-containing protein [Flexivirga oryzae]|uniref:Cell division protein FtsI/penicillin-binding protein 2 n=1 Tax=Flexivirga oryzae TaxID=1794944 RepID=A0A839NEP8_9MICO|nr:penicillin-binding transpeptidase domain-containing protein [Flexivirga oryzae]MBB2893171.1 cell division protein FtsI/penicillin-binding protein 2 [Flexivirga oryzae]
MSSRTVLGVTAGALVIAGGVGGYMYLQQASAVSKQDSAAKAAATAFAQDWSARTLDKAVYVGTTPKAAADNFATATAALGKGPISVQVDDFNRDGDTGTATLHVAWTLSGKRVFKWDDPIALVKSADGTWGIRVDATKSLWHPKLQASDAFVVNQTMGLRGEIRGADDSGIMTNQKVYDISIDPTKATDASIGQLQNVLNIAGLVTKLHAAKKSGSQALIPVITYRQSDYFIYQNGIQDLQGVVVQTRRQPLAATSTFGQPLLGTVGQVTADMIKKHPKTYRAGDYAGLYGLQAQYDATMRPTSGFTVTPRSDTSDILFGTKAKNGTNLKTTLDPTVQNAAEKALASMKDKPAAIVAVNVKTGGVSAVANSPYYGIDRALLGRYAPGSQMKIATTYALLTHGFDPDSKVPCPRNVYVNGYKIGNFEGETGGNPKFSKDFAMSCNTAFVKASSDFTDTELQQAANSLGLGADWADRIGVAGTFAGNVPTANGATDKAVSVFGQGRVQASPLSIAVMTGSVARGSYLAPELVTSPAPAKGARSATPLKAGAIQEIKKLMRLTVTDGTATAVKKVPGGPVYAKTGTSEFAEGGKTGVNGWLTGWQGNTAFCVLVEDVPSGKSGGNTAAPLAAKFLTTLATS